MGIFEVLSSTADDLKRRLPNPYPVKNACFSTFNAARAASPDLSAASSIFQRSASFLDRSIRVDVPRWVSGATADPDCRKRIAHTSWKFFDYALEHGTKSYTGGFPVYKLLKEGLLSGEPPSSKSNEMNNIKKRLEKLEALEAARVAKGEAANNPQDI